MSVSKWTESRGEECSPRLVLPWTFAWGGGIVSYLLFISLRILLPNFCCENVKIVESLAAPFVNGVQNGKLRVKLLKPLSLEVIIILLMDIPPAAVQSHR